MSKVKSAPSWECGECSQNYVDKDMAEKCCICPRCHEEIPKPAYGSPLTIHSKCQGQQWDEREKKTLQDAKLLDNYDGWLYYGDKYYSDMEALMDDLYYFCENGEGWPTRTHTCTEIPFPALDIERIIENLQEEQNVDDDYYRDFDKTEVLEKAIKEFNEANKSKVTYYVDTQHAVEVDPYEKED